MQATFFWLGNNVACSPLGTGLEYDYSTALSITPNTQNDAATEWN